MFPFPPVGAGAEGGTEPGPEAGTGAGLGEELGAKHISETCRSAWTTTIPATFLRRG